MNKKGHRLPEEIRKTAPFSFRLRHADAEKLKEMMVTSEALNLGDFIEKLVLRRPLKVSSVKTKQRHKNRFSEDSLSQLRGVAKNLNQLTAAQNTLIKNRMMTEEAAKRFSYRAERILDHITTILEETQSVDDSKSNEKHSNGEKSPSLQRE